MTSDGPAVVDNDVMQPSCRPDAVDTTPHCSCAFCSAIMTDSCGIQNSHRNVWLHKAKGPGMSRRANAFIKHVAEFGIVHASRHRPLGAPTTFFKSHLFPRDRRMHFGAQIRSSLMSPENAPLTTADSITDVVGP